MTNGAVAVGDVDGVFVSGVFWFNGDRSRGASCGGASVTGDDANAGAGRTAAVEGEALQAPGDGPETLAGETSA